MTPPVPFGGTYHRPRPQCCHSFSPGKQPEPGNGSRVFHEAANFGQLLRSPAETGSRSPGPGDIPASPRDCRCGPSILCWRRSLYRRSLLVMRGAASSLSWLVILVIALAPAATSARAMVRADAGPGGHHAGIQAHDSAAERLSGATHDHDRRASTDDEIGGEAARHHDGAGDGSCCAAGCVVAALLDGQAIPFPLPRHTRAARRVDGVAGRAADPPRRPPRRLT